jgi:hypothetical protein
MNAFVASATPADDSSGADLVRAALLFQDHERSGMTDEQRFASLYLLGYVDGSLRTLHQSGLVAFDGETDLPSVFRDLDSFIGDSKILRTAPATDIVGAFLLLKYGETKESRQAGLSLTMKIVGEVGAVELAKAKKIAEQGGTGQPATRPELKSEGSDKPQPESEGRSR